MIRLRGWSAPTTQPFCGAQTARTLLGMVQAPMLADATLARVWSALRRVLSLEAETPAPIDLVDAVATEFGGVTDARPPRRPLPCCAPLSTSRACHSLRPCYGVTTAPSSRTTRSAATRCLSIGEVAILFGCRWPSGVVVEPWVRSLGCSLFFSLALRMVDRRRAVDAPYRRAILHDRKPSSGTLGVTVVG